MLQTSRKIKTMTRQNKKNALLPGHRTGVPCSPASRARISGGRACISDMIPLQQSIKGRGGGAGEKDGIYGVLSLSSLPGSWGDGPKEVLCRFLFARKYFGACYLVSVY